MITSTQQQKRTILQRFFPSQNSQYNKCHESTMGLNSNWDRMLDIEDTIIWEDEDYSALAEYEYGKRFCQIRFSDQESKAQSTLLGFDLKANQLLIDEIFPTVTHTHFDTAFEIVFYSPNSLLIIGVNDSKPVEVDGQIALLVNVEYKLRSYDRRAKPRISFERERSPKIELLIPMHPAIKGQLSNLSSSGLKMFTFNANKPELAHHRGECTIVFNELHKLSTRICVKQVNHLRRPTQHSTLRLMFVDPPSEHIDQVNAFIQSFQAINHQHSTSSDWGRQSGESAIS